ncbi:MAG: P-loop NTPase, partial [Planctomycetota bacterium]
MDQAQKLREMVYGGAPEAKERARVLAVTSGKGGVGKTNLSVALALEASGIGRDVVLVDGDLGLANVDVILDIQARYNLSHLLSGDATLEETLVPAPGGLRVLPGAAGITRMADLSPPERQLLLDSLDSLEQCTELM